MRLNAAHLYCNSGATCPAQVLVSYACCLEGSPHLLYISMKISKGYQTFRSRVLGLVSCRSLSRCSRSTRGQAAGCNTVDVCINKSRPQVRELVLTESIPVEQPAKDHVKAAELLGLQDSCAQSGNKRVSRSTKIRSHHVRRT